ncbi:hypothetical protein MWN33_02385 [Starkeya koreensis]|uniref:DUF3035 domain-containing protein n=1 Tax=Ancylobacter koreensis TaxID=266121 RepID=A0ABT0DI42_9HYPH|nr:hypothetical protein [Ancylobacter koreensis]MCK0206874.1 hypothetical protein [Ancylobacter koreensis]
MTTKPRSTRAAILAGAALCALALAAPASAQEDMNLTGQLLTGLGLVAPMTPDIDYRERAPLVVPPTGDVLPPPRDASAISQNPAWPKDHDVVAREKEKATTVVDMRTLKDTASRKLTPAELERGGKAGAYAPGARASGRRNDDNRLSLNQLDFFGWGNKKDTALKFEGEPEREALIQPPPGYQTPAPGAAYGVVADRAEEKEWKLKSWFDRTQSNK